MILAKLVCCFVTMSYVNCSLDMKVTFSPPTVHQLEERSSTSVTVCATSSYSNFSVIARSENVAVAFVPKHLMEFESVDKNQFCTNLTVIGKFLGYTKIILQTFPKEPSNSSEDPIEENYSLKVSVIRVPRIWDKLFLISMTILVSFIYVNFGCALDWTLVRDTLKRPVGPAIGFVSQFLFMPLISFGLARVLFKDQPALQLGLFFAGCSPGGAASNLWAVALNGNLDLSITMTAISTFASFAMIPFWVLTMGHTIFEEANLRVPYRNITFTAVMLMIPLFIGILVQLYLPRVCKFMVKALKPYAFFLILFIIIFATVTNLHLFSFMTWRVLLGGLLVPLLGFIFGAILAKIFRQSYRDITTISIETGVQNAAICVYLLQFSLETPEADIAAVCPVTVALLSTFPLAVWYFIIRIMDRNSKLKTGAELVPTEEDENCSMNTIA